jgi:murein DD-endopeptidase MepM/ murein hydrolase activator NlpD
MPIDLYVGPQRRRPWRVLWLAIAALVLAGVLAWQQGWQPELALAQLSRDVLQRAPLPLPQLQTQVGRPRAGAVVLVNSTLVERPESQAYTDDLYSPTAADGTVPWPNVDGRAQVRTYTVQEGDTLWSIAVQFGLDLDTLRWSNPALERNPDILAISTELIILPVQGVYHIVSAEDTIESIAAQYGVAETDISNYPPNGLYPPYKLKVGHGLIVPFGRKGGVLPQPDLAVDAPLAWPVAGTMTGGFEPDHPALDIGAPYGSTVYAATAGTVRYAGWGEEGLGFTIVIDHGDGLETLYLHLKGALIQAGTAVARGDAVGEVGSTGHSSGPHVHFEVRRYGQLVNPQEFLPSLEPQ